MAAAEIFLTHDGKTIFLQSNTRTLALDAGVGLGAVSDVIPSFYGMCVGEGVGR